MISRATLAQFVFGACGLLGAAVGCGVDPRGAGSQTSAASAGAGSGQGEPAASLSETQPTTPPPVPTTEAELPDADPDPVAPGNSPEPAMPPPVTTQEPEVTPPVMPPDSRPFGVVAYGPFREGQSPSGEHPTEAQLRQDLEHISLFAKGVRTYGSNGAEGLIPKICDEVGLDVHMGIWVDGQDGDAEAVQQGVAIVNEGHPSIKTVIVGNEALLRARNAAANGMTEERMVELIQMARSGIAVHGVRIGSAETLDDWLAPSPARLAAVDVILWHVHPWWNAMGVSGASAYVMQRFSEMQQLYPDKQVILAETGWPSRFDQGAAIGSEENQAKYVGELLQDLKTAGAEGWIFSVYDEPWKSAEGEGEVGGFWGLYAADRSPKAVQQVLGLPLYP